MDQQSGLRVEAAAKRSMRRLAIIVAAVVLLTAATIWGTHYWLVGRFFVSTDDAYLQADSALIAPKVSGYVSGVFVENNQPVHQGQLLFTIDDRDYKVALAGAKADMAAAQAAIISDIAQIGLQKTRIAEAAAQLEADRARLAFATTNQRRYAALVRTGASTRQNADQADTGLATAKATVDADSASLAGAQRQVDVLRAELAQARASLAQATASARQATINLGHTQVVAPFEGVVGNKTVALGDYLQIGTPVMAVVPLNAVYITANYKETQVEGIEPGQPVSVSVDGFPDLKVTGTVESIAPSSGQEFALLPPDNATGNFIKIVQRVPVKIVLNLNRDNLGKLRPGMSVEPDIDTRPRRRHAAP